MEQESFEALTVAAMLAVLSCVATVHWKQQRAVSWGALGILLLIPEATSRAPSAALLNAILALTAVLVVGQLAFDVRRRGQRVQPLGPSVDMSSPEYTSRPIRPGEMASLLGAATVRTEGTDAASV